MNARKKAIGLPLMTWYFPASATHSGWPYGMTGTSTPEARRAFAPAWISENGKGLRAFFSVTPGKHSGEPVFSRLPLPFSCQVQNPSRMPEYVLSWLNEFTIFWGSDRAQ